MENICKRGGNMSSGILAYRNIQNSILNGVKIPHSTSQPLIFGENGKYYLAVFVFFLTDKESDLTLRLVPFASLFN